MRENGPRSGRSTDKEVPAGDEQASNSWLVLLVDDEPEIHEITRLVLADVSFAGWPVELRSAYSATQAKAFLQSHPGTALLLLDVVMESDDAGLALVRHIRDYLHNLDLQIVLRTGQPGMAPERDVVLQYEINGYFLKTEITAQKLYSIVISALRTYQYIKTLQPVKRKSLVHRSEAFAGQRQQMLEENLAKAIEADALHLLAQPQVHLASNSIAGIEIIPGWKTQEGVLGPAQLAEAVHDPELRLKFDQWLLRKACGWARSWQGLGVPPFRVCVPLLTEHVGDRRLLAVVDQCLADFGLARGTLDLEMPETILLGERSSTREAIAYVQSQGVSVTLLDFGSGMISLPQLQRLLPDRVKIDRTFVRNVSNDRERSAIARSIIALAHTLEMTVVADGIATELDLQFFKWEGCDIGQGDLLATSAAVADVHDVLRAKKAITH
jgi:EAL domain-containing protein (putative c-di-GMP-specific phosphodiesterase class I)